MSPLDRTTYLAAAGLMAALGIVGAYVPAARASRVDPMEALRTE